MSNPSSIRPDMRRHPPKDPMEYEQEVFQKGLKHERPPLTFKPWEWERQANTRLSTTSNGYLANAGQSETYNKNLAAFKRWSIVPRRLVRAGHPKLEVKVLGQQLNYPIAIAPIGVQTIFHSDGEKGSASAAASENVPYIMSTASSTSIEDVAKANGDGVRWYQLYWPNNEDNEITKSILQRAQKAGFSALIVTLDTYLLGWRPEDMDNGYNPFLRSDTVGVDIGFTDPIFRRMFKEKHGIEIEDDPGKAAAEWTRTVFPGKSHSWEDIKFLQENWAGPIVLKGIQSVEDAESAVRAGVQGIVVSNHGGRQQDGGNSSLGVLPQIVDAVGDKIDVLYDSGIRSGSDILKALALGAKCCLIGRPYIWGLALGGKSGVSHVIRALLGELEVTMHIAGIPSVEKGTLSRKVLVREDQLFDYKLN